MATSRLDTLAAVLARDFAASSGQLLPQSVVFGGTSDEADDETIYVTTFDGVVYVFECGSDDDEFVFTAPGRTSVVVPFSDGWVGLAKADEI